MTEGTDSTSGEWPNQVLILRFCHLVAVVPVPNYLTSLVQFFPQESGASDTYLRGCLGRFQQRCI